MTAVRIAKSTGLPDRRTGMHRARRPVAERLAAASTPKRRNEVLSRTVLMPVDLLDALEPYASARGLHVNALVRDLLDAIAEEGLVAAILDEEGGA